jgi:hypothetical protein
MLGMLTDAAFRAVGKRPRQPYLGGRAVRFPINSMASAITIPRIRNGAASKSNKTMVFMMPQGFSRFPRG